MNVTCGPFAKCFPGQNLEFQSWLKTNKTCIKTEARWPPYQSSSSRTVLFSWSATCSRRYLIRTNKNGLSSILPTQFYSMKRICYPRFFSESRIFRNILQGFSLRRGYFFTLFSCKNHGWKTAFQPIFGSF